MPPTTLQSFDRICELFVFFVFFRTFHLRLKRNAAVFSENFHLVLKNGSTSADLSHLYSGSLEGE